MADYLDELELSIKTTNTLRTHNVTEVDFFHLTQNQWRLWGGLVKGWKEIEQVRPLLRVARRQKRRESTIGRACIAVRELNELRHALAAEQLFITKDDDGRFRVGRYITKGDLNADWKWPQ